MVKLHTNMCQHNVNTYSEVLNRIHTGDHTVEDIQLLRTRLTSGVVNPVQLQDPVFSSPLYLLPRKEQFEEYNLPHGVTSRDVSEHLIPKDDNNCAGLPHTLKLALGAQVMLRRNIMCEDGLVNGVRGEIVGFKWSGSADRQDPPGMLPAAVLVKFHDPCVG